jgi:hypothetical protein
VEPPRAYSRRGSFRTTSLVGDDVVHAAARLGCALHRGVPRHGVDDGGERRLPPLDPVRSRSVRVGVLGAVHHVALIGPDLDVARSEHRLGAVRLHGLDLKVDLSAREHVVVRETRDRDRGGLGRRDDGRLGLLLALAAEMIAPTVLDEVPAGRARVLHRERAGRRRRRLIGLGDPLVVDGAKLADRPKLEDLPRLRLGLRTVDHDLDVLVTAVVLRPLRDGLAAAVDDLEVADLAAVLPRVRELAVIVTPVRERLARLDPARLHRILAVLRRLDAVGALPDRDDHVVSGLELLDLLTRRLLDLHMDVGSRSRRRVGRLDDRDGRRLRDTLRLGAAVGACERREDRPAHHEGGEDGRELLELHGRITYFRGNWRFTARPTLICPHGRDIQTTYKISTRCLVHLYRQSVC